jgi:LacI family transcriptional regulator
MKTATISDISKATGLSITTISRVLNGKAEQTRISKSAQELVLRVARELNYSPNRAAQSLRMRKTHTIGLLVPCIENPFFANIASVVINEANKYMYPVMVLDTRDNPAEEERALTTLLSRNVDGIIMAPTGESSERLQEIRKTKPLILIDRYFEGTDLPYVASDNYNGAYEATKHLLSAGHRHILCIQGSPLSVTSKERVRGYCDAIDSVFPHGDKHICGNEYSLRNGYVETKLALCSKTKYTAILALSSTILLGSLKAIYESGLSIPEDISIVTFDDDIYLDFLNPPITRVAQPLAHIGMMGVKLIMEHILDPSTPLTSSMLLAPTMIHRSSVKINI